MEENNKTVLKIDDKLPELEFEVFHEGEEKKMSFSDFSGKWLIVFFYPSDFTFVCPTELEELADRYEQFKEVGAEIVSFSTDSVFVHKAWKDQSKAIAKITFPMGADSSGKVSRLFGVYLEDEGVALRGSFIIDPDGVLQAYEINNNDIGRSARELLRKIQAAKFVRENEGQVCPASWEPGGETLEPGMDLVGKI